MESRDDGLVDGRFYGSSVNNRPIFNILIWTKLLLCYASAVVWRLNSSGQNNTKQCRRLKEKTTNHDQLTTDNTTAALAQHGSEQEEEDDEIPGLANAWFDDQQTNDGY